MFCFTVAVVSFSVSDFVNLVALLFAQCLIRLSGTYLRSPVISSVILNVN